MDAIDVASVLYIYIREIEFHRFFLFIIRSLICLDEDDFELSARKPCLVSDREIMGNDFLISATISASCSIKKRFSIFKKYINCINKFIYLFDTMEIIIYKL